MSGLIRRLNMKYQITDTVDAFKWTAGQDQTEDPEWIIEALKKESVRIVCTGTSKVQLHIDTPTGTEIATPGDYIVKGVKGVIYPCKSVYFEHAYSPIDRPVKPPVIRKLHQRLPETDF